MLKKMQKCNIFGLIGASRGNYCPMQHILDRFHRADVKLRFMCNATTYRFQDICS